MICNNERWKCKSNSRLQIEWKNINNLFIQFISLLPKNNYVFSSKWSHISFRLSQNYFTTEHSSGHHPNPKQFLLKSLLKSNFSVLFPWPTSIIRQKWQLPNCSFLSPWLSPVLKDRTTNAPRHACFSHILQLLSSIMKDLIWLPSIEWREVPAGPSS